MGEAERKIQAGEREAVKAAELVQVKNYRAMIQYIDEHKKAILELASRVEALQNKMMSMDVMLEAGRKQLATLQQEFYKRGTTSYSDGKG